ncbi:hypothetical protein F5883DRAFT_232714 [Diaporthe sp. PMI_573]|nr:hypothetical protein F5883DRAFT_232714 [Diaporthaceae sp. PMI_573]
MMSLMSTFRPRQPNSPAGARRHRCSMCPQAFARSEHLVRHERSHRGEKPFRCTLCNTQFTRKDLIKSHVRRQHPGEADRYEAGAILQGQESATSAKQGSGLPIPATASAMPYSPTYGSVLNWEPVSPISVGAQTQPGGNGTRAEFAGVVAGDFGFDFDSLFEGMDFGDATRNLPGPRPQPDVAITTNAGLEVPSTPSILDVQLDASTVLPPPTIVEQVSATSVTENPTQLGSFEISETKRTSIAAEMKTAQTYGSFGMPSCLQLERFITACFDSLFSLLPCIHLPTWRAEDAHPCLLLAMASFGAKYCKRRDLAVVLHRASRTATLDQLAVLDAGVHDQPLWLMQALFLVMCFGTWSGEVQLSHEAPSIQSLLTEMFRSSPAPRNSQNREHARLSWAEWVEVETAIRTRYTVYQYFSLITRAFNISPAICNVEIDLLMPSSDAEWTAPTAQEWEACRAHSPGRPTFLATLDSLLGTSATEVPFVSPFGAHIMLHALLQQMWFARQDRWSPCSSSHTAHLRSALDKWEARAQLDQESSISPYSPQAPLLYNSHSLLRLARLYLCGDLASVHTTFTSHSVDKISHAMMTQVKVGRFAPDAQAALLAAHSLRVPLKVGVALNSGCGSLQYQLFSLDCGLYLSKWLQVLLATPEMTWSPEEKEVVALATSILSEVDLPLDKAQKPLSAQIAYACSMILDGIDTWGISDILLAALKKHADNLALVS